ncbi:MAG: GGDEF domain-containing protein [Planctomycetota bacterium]
MKRTVAVVCLVASALLQAAAVILRSAPRLVPAAVRAAGLTDLLCVGLAALAVALLFYGLYLFLRVHDEQARRVRELASEVAHLNSQNTFFLQQMPTMKADIESLTTMREISRAINIHVEFEKILEEVLRIISQMTGAAVLDVYLSDPAAPEGAVRLKAHFSARGEHGYVYLYFDTDPAQYPAHEIAPGDFRHFAGDSHTVVDTTLFHGGLCIGSGKVVVRSASADTANLELFLREKAGSLEVDAGDIGRAITVRAIVRVQEGRTLTFTAPLIADQKVLGVIRASFESVITAMTPDLVEGMLRDSCQHIALAVKKADLYEKAVKDGMTNLFNKPHFVNQLNLAIGLAQSGAKTFSLLMSDIDHFKKVNDTWGHLTGDIILIGVANILRRNLREHDMAFRYGGEEMAIILDDTNAAAAARVAERIRKAVKAKAFTGERGEPVTVTISIGVSEFFPGPMTTAEDLISRADQALYKAKESGRDRVVVANKPGRRATG